MKFTYLTDPSTVLEWARKLTNDLNTFASNLNGVPTGAQIGWHSTTAPVGWVLCDGSSFATTKYPALFAELGYTYGGSGANFNVPANTSGFTYSVIKT